MAYRHWRIGLDPGFFQDFTAIAVAERFWPELEEALAAHQRGEMSRGEVDRSFAQVRRDKPPAYRVHHLERLPLRIDTDQLVSAGLATYRRLQAHLGDVVDVIVDRGGPGSPICDVLRKQLGNALIPLVITATGDPAFRRGELRVARTDLLQRLAALWANGRIRLPADLVNASDLEREVINLETRTSSQSGRYTIAHRSGQHDDLVMALAYTVVQDMLPTPKRARFAILTGSY